VSIKSTSLLVLGICSKRTAVPVRYFAKYIVIIYTGIVLNDTTTQNLWRSYGYPVLQSKNIFAPPTTKTAEFEVKNRRKSAEEAKAEPVL